MNRLKPLMRGELKVAVASGLPVWAVPSLAALAIYSSLMTPSKTARTQNQTG